LRLRKGGTDDVSVVALNADMYRTLFLLDCNKAWNFTDGSAVRRGKRCAGTGKHKRGKNTPQKYNGNDYFIFHFYASILIKTQNERSEVLRFEQSFQLLKVYTL